MSDCKSVATPIECNLNLEKGKENKRIDKPYRELISCLMYVALTSRPDLCAATIYFSQFQNCPNEKHWVNLKRILRYIKGTLDLKLIYEGNVDREILKAFADADWASNKLDRKSLSGYIFKVYGATVCWLTRKQSTIALSSTEAELISLTNAVCHGAWLERLLEDLGCKLTSPVPYYEDNQSTIRVAEDERNLGRLKHMNVKHLFIRDRIHSGKIILKYIASAEQQADIMTKGFPRQSFTMQRMNLGLLGILN